MKAHIIAAALMLPLLAQAAPNWVKYAYTDDTERPGGFTRYYYDKTSVKTLANGNKLVWTNWIFETGDRKVAQWEANCKEQTQALRFFSKFDAAGSVLESFPVPAFDREWFPVPPASVGEAVIEAVCSNRPSKSAT
jgi:hypothetical protein